MSEAMRRSRRRAGIPQGLTVVIAAFLPIMAIVSLFPAVPSIIDRFHADPTAQWKVPWMVSAPGLSIALIAPFAGILVDRFGRRRLVLVATFFYGLLGAVPVLLDTLNAVFISRTLLGICEAIILTTLNTLIGDYWNEDGRRHWLSIQGAIGPFFGAGLILLSGYLTAWRWNGVFFIYLVAFPILLAMLAFMFEPERDDAARRFFGSDEKPVAGAFPIARVTVIGLVTLFSSIIYFVYAINGGLAFREIGIASSEQLGRITFVPSMVVMLGSAVFWVTARFRFGVQFGILFLFQGGGLLLMGLAGSLPQMIAGLCLQQVGVGMTVPVLLAWAQKQLPFEHRGRGMGIWSACFFLGQFVSPPLVALLVRGVGTMQQAFAIAGIIGLIGAGAGFLLLLRAAPAAPQRGPA